MRDIIGAMYMTEGRGWQKPLPQNLGATLPNIQPRHLWTKESQLPADLFGL